MILLQQYFISNNQDRQKEIDETLKKNINHPLIEEIHLLNEKVYNLKYPKIKEFNINKRLTYTDAFKHLINIKDKIVILSNNDIYFDKTLNLLKDWKKDWDNKIICLTRHELTKENKIVNQSESKVFYYNNVMMNVEPKWSHDTWIFKSNQIKNIICDFYLGTLGCEGALACSIRNKGFDIINGYPYIKAIHNHRSMHRTYDAKHQIHSVEECTRIKYDIFNNEIKTIRNLNSTSEENYTLKFLRENFGLTINKDNKAVRM